MKTKNVIIVVVLSVLSLLVLQQLLKPKYASLPEEYLDDRAKFGEVNQLFNDAMTLTEPPDDTGTPFDIPQNQQDRIITKLKGGIELSEEIDDSFLDYLHPELKRHFRNEYVRGNQFFLEGITGDTSTIKSVGVQKQIESNNLIVQWVDWWNIHRDEITDKAFAE